MTSNEKNNLSLIKNVFQTTSKEILFFILTKSFILMGLIAFNCVLIFLIGMIIYLIIRRIRKSNDSHLNIFPLNKIIPIQNNNVITNNKFEFHPLQNDSYIINEENNANISLSEMNAKGNKIHSNCYDVDIEEDIVKNKQIEKDVEIF